MAKRIRRTAPAASSQRSAGGGAAPRRRRGGRVRGKLVTDFTVQLATLSEAGIPMVKALTILEGQTKSGPFKDVLAELAEDVSGGAPLSEAMAKHDRCFDTLYTSMVKAGEVGGVLDRILLRIAMFREAADEIKGKIVNALIYPVILAVVAVLVVSLVITIVIPKFDDIFETFDVEIPTPTQVLLEVSRVATEAWYLVFGVPVALALLHLVLLARSEGYRRRIHAMMLRVPIFGGLQQVSLIARFARTFGTLVQAGVPHLDALSIVRDATSNLVLQDGVEHIRRTVREGEGIARPMGETGMFDDLVTNMVDVGEETGELDTMLLKVADAYEKVFDRRLDAFFRFLEPALLVAMAVVVGFIVIALFLPLLEIMGSIQG